MQEISSIFLDMPLSKNLGTVFDKNPNTMFLPFFILISPLIYNEIESSIMRNIDINMVFSETQVVVQKWFIASNPKLTTSYHFICGKPLHSFMLKNMPSVLALY